MLSVNPASSGSSASSATDTSNITAFVSQNTIGILAAVPSAPTSVVATSGNTSLAVTWAAPASTGGSNITDYLVKYSSNNGVAGSWTRWGKTTVITATSCTVTGLTNGTAYVIKVIAKNAVGISLPSANSAPATPAATYSVANPLPPRIQWNANYGYCGEASFISAGLFYGQYLSQYDARAIASNNARQNLSSSQLLLGVNDVAAAKAMHLAATPFNTSTQTSTTAFLTWVKSNVIAGYPVVMGVFMNQSRFYGNKNLNAGDTEYDHIVVATGITSRHPLTGPAVYYADDIITFNDNGLWTGTPNGQPQNVFSCSFGTFAATRQQANATTRPVYSLNNGPDYGIAITGIIDLSRETVPVRLATSVNAESTGIVNNSTTRPAFKPVTLTVTVSGLTPGVTYNLYRYSSMAAVPDSNINANAAKAVQKRAITITSGSTFTMTQTIKSNQIVVYRAVPVGAP